MPEGRDNSGQADSAKDSRHPDKDKETKAKKTSKKGTKKGQCGTDKENHPVSDTSAKVTRKRGRPKKENGPPKKKGKLHSMKCAPEKNVYKQQRLQVARYTCSVQ